MDSLARLKRPPNLILDISRSAVFVTLPLLDKFYFFFSLSHWMASLWLSVIVTPPRLPAASVRDRSFDETVWLGFKYSWGLGKTWLKKKEGGGGGLSASFKKKKDKQIIENDEIQLDSATRNMSLALIWKSARSGIWMSSSVLVCICGF